MALELFLLENNQPVLNPVLLTIPQFSRIIRRDRGSDGDAQGKRKAFASMEIAAVFWLGYYNSPIFQNEESEYITKVISYTGLPSSWEPDELVMQAVDFWKAEIDKNAALEELNELRGLFKTGKKVIKASTIYLESQLEAIAVNQMSTNTSGQQVYAIDECMNVLEKVQKIVKTIPESVAQIKKIEDTIKSNESVRGKAGREINEFEV